MHNIIIIQGNNSRESYELASYINQYSPGRKASVSEKNGFWEIAVLEDVEVEPEHFYVFNPFVRFVKNYDVENIPVEGFEMHLPFQSFDFIEYQTARVNKPRSFKEDIKLFLKNELKEKHQIEIGESFLDSILCNSITNKIITNYYDGWSLAKVHFQAWTNADSFVEDLATGLKKYSIQNIQTMKHGALKRMLYEDGKK